MTKELKMISLIEFIDWYWYNSEASEESIKAMVDRLLESDHAKLSDLMSSEHIAREVADPFEY